MKNSFFILISFAFFITSCTKEFVEPVNLSVPSETVTNRTQVTSVSGSVASYEVGIEDIVIHLVIPGGTPTGLVPTDSQTFQFSDSEDTVEDVTLELSTYDIGIEDIIIHLVAPPSSLTGMTIVNSQTIDLK